MKAIKIGAGAVLLALTVACSGENKETNQEMEVADITIFDQESFKDSVKNELMAAMTEIEAGLTEIKEREGFISFAPGAYDTELGESQKDRIINDIKTINSLLDDNVVKVDELLSRLKRYKLNNKKFEKLLAEKELQLKSQSMNMDSLTNRLIEKELDIVELNGILTRLQADTSTMASNIIELSTKNEELTAKNQTAYYAMGTYKELKENKVAEREGGVFGIGGAKNMKDNVNQEYFTQINIYENTSIPLHSDKAVLLTEHDVNSYEIVQADGDSKLLSITDPAEFWKTNKYLVVETK